MNRILSGERLVTLLVSILGIWCLINAESASSQPKADNTKPLTLQQALELTLEQHPSLDVFQIRQKALDGEQSTASQNPGYQLGVELEKFAGNGEFSGVDNAELTVSLSSAVELGGKLDARLGIVKSQRTYLETQKELQALELLSETTRRYINLLTAQERVKLAEESLQLAKEAFQVAKRRASLGATMKAEVKRAQASLAQAELTLEKEQADLSVFSANLSIMWNEQDLKHYLASGNLFHFGQTVSFEELFQKVKDNPAIKQFAAQERLKQSELELARANNQSNFNWSVGVTRSQATGDMGLKAGFSMDLFSESRNQGEIQSAVAAQKEVFVSKKTALLRMRDQLFSAYEQRKQSVQTVDRLQQDIIPTLASALKDTQNAYQRGRYSYFEYVSARQELIVAKRKLIDAANAALIFGVTIEQLTAEPLTSTQQNL